MKVETVSVLIGTKACPSKCPFCIAKMTHDPSEENGRFSGEDLIRYSKALRRAFELAERNGCTTCLLTSKGEATLPKFRTDLYNIAHEARQHFPLVELQTSGLYLSEINFGKMDLSTVAISVIHYDNGINAKNYSPSDPGKYLGLVGMIDLCHQARVSVRLTLMLQRGVFDSVAHLRSMIRFCRNFGVEQLTVRNITRPNSPTKSLEDTDVATYVRENALSQERMNEMYHYVAGVGTPLLRLSYGATVFDVEGQNVCMSNCLTINEKEDTIRSLIVYPDGHVRYSWDYKGAILF